MIIKNLLIALTFIFFSLKGFSALTTPTLVSPSTGSLNNSPDVTIDWSTVTGATAYEYKLSTVSNLAGASVVSVTTSLAITSNLKFGTVYYWQVRAVKSTAPADSSAWSPIWSFTTIDQLTLASPTSGTTNQTPDVTLDWTGITGITYYDYQWDTSATFSSPLNHYGSIAVGTSQITSSNLRFGTKYYWRARARHTADTTLWSATWNFTTINQLTLVSPTSGTSNQTPDVILDWTGITGITFYDYQWDTSATFSSTLNHYGSIAVGTSQITSSDLRFGTKYYWRVRARHTADTTLWSAVWKFTTIDQLTLVSPTSGTTNQTPDVILDWTGITGITYYDYQWDTIATFTSPLNHYGSIAVGTSQITSSNLRFGTKYYWHARARHAADTTLWSATWNFTTIDQLTLVSPTSGATNQTPDVILDWTGITGITYYDYQWDTVSTFTSPLNHYGSIAVGTSQITSSNLRFGTRYYWRARARNIADTTQWSAIWNFTTTDQLTLVSPSSGATNQTPDVILDWNALTGITYYDYQWDTIATFTSPLNHYGSIAVGTSQITSSNLRFGTRYYWRARARHTSDTTQWTPVWNFTTVEYITHVTPANNATSISLNPIIDWNPMTGITGYQYRYSTDANFTNPSLFTIGTSSSQATLSNLSYGTQYFWQVRVFHAADTSLWSIPWNFTTLYQITTAPTLVSPANNATNILTTGTNLVWTSVSGATLYEYQFDNNNAFTNPVSNTTTNLNASTGNLTPNLPYYWKVRAGNGSGFSPWSSVWTFSVGTPCTTYNINENITVCSGASHTFPDGYVQNNITTGFIHVSNLQTVALCDSIINTTVNVNTIDATVTANNNTLTANATGATYVWVDCNNNFTPIPGQTLQSFTPTTNGSYAVILTSGNCSLMSACYVMTTVDIKENTDNDVVKIYPNPSNGLLNIEMGKEQKNITIEILSVTGQQLHQEEYSDVKTINLSLELPKGIYFIRMSNDGFTRMEKVAIW